MLLYNICPFDGSSREERGAAKRAPRKGLIRPERRVQKDCTYPPLNAPTGFRAGNAAAASASLCEEVWKLRVVRRAAEEERAWIAGDSIRDAIVVGGIKLVVEYETFFKPNRWNFLVVCAIRWLRDGPASLLLSGVELPRIACGGASETRQRERCECHLFSLSTIWFVGFKSLLTFKHSMA